MVHQYIPLIKRLLREILFESGDATLADFPGQIICPHGQRTRVGANGRQVDALSRYPKFFHHKRFKARSGTGFISRAFLTQTKRWIKCFGNVNSSVIVNPRMQWVVKSYGPLCTALSGAELDIAGSK